LFLKSAVRAVLRRWRLAAAVAGAAFALGLLALPRPFAFTARARLAPLPERWTAGRLQDFALGDAVLDQAARSLGYEDGSELRPGLSAKTDRDGVVLSLTAATRTRAVERVNAVGKAAELLSSTARRSELDASLRRTDEALAARRRDLDQIAPRLSPADRAAHERIDALEKALDSSRAEIAAESARIDALGRALERNETGPARPLNTAESDRLNA